MAVPRVGIVNPEAPVTVVRPITPAPASGISTGQRTTLPSQTRSMNGQPPLVTPKPPATLFPLPAGKPATSVTAPGGMISQAPAATRTATTSSTRGNQTPAALAARAAARPQAPVAPIATPPAATTPTAPTTGKPGNTGSDMGASANNKKQRKPYVPPEGYDRLAGYSADASPDQIAFEKAQIYARNKARGNTLTTEQVEQRFNERLQRYQSTGEPSKNRDPEDAVAAPAETVLTPEQQAMMDQQQAMQDQLTELTDLVRDLQEQLKKPVEETAPQATAPAQTGTSQLQTLAQALTPKPAAGSLAGLDPARISLMLQTAAPVMFTGSFAEVVSALLAAGITPSATELAWLESEVARYRAG
jgi:hypothetical protein